MKLASILLAPFCISLVACDSAVAPNDAAADVASPQDTAMDAPADVRPNDAAADVAPADASPDVATDTGVDVSVDRTVVTDAPVDVSVDRTVVADNGADVPSGAGCGGRGGAPCPGEQFCDFPPSSICGAADGPGMCRTRPDICTRELNPVCGCDGMTYSNPCLAAARGVSVARLGACRSADAGSPDAATACAAQDARSVGTCEPLRGYAWNGRACVIISGCSCEGADCGRLFPSDAACRAAYPMCDCRTFGCPDTSTCQACLSPGGAVFACIPRGAAC